MDNNGDADRNRSHRRRHGNRRMIVLDSDILSLMLWRGATPSRLDERLGQVPANELVTTIVTYEEQVRGWMKVIARAKTMSEQIEAYRRLHQQLKLYREVPILDFEEVAATRFQQPRKQFRRLQTSDLKIASIALANNALLITRNLRHFQQIPGLRAEDWTR
jgi:tRNA(fMet)-specific endonuclease VapC